MLVCPTAFLEDQTRMSPRERTYNKMVTSAMPLSHHLSSEDSINPINFSSNLLLQYKIRGPLVIVIITSHCLSIHTQKSL